MCAAVMVQNSNAIATPPPLPSSSSATSSLSRSSSSSTIPNPDCTHHHNHRNTNRSTHQHLRQVHHQHQNPHSTMAEGGSSGRISRAGSGGLGHHTDCSDDDLDATCGHILDRVNKSDRMPVTKPEEDRRRRTIIVEKKNNSYGFTLQSYGIHYKKEQEIEMITYVDYVEYDGPAYKSGMREGDVILSINGSDMEKADHKTLVAFIKGCDTRMRMVVLFEDCVRKVELHMRYIQLQTILQGKMNELERTCLRERELLEGKWKTHSLPARKKANPSGTADGLIDNNLASPSAGGDDDGSQQVIGGGSTSFCRPAMSTEDVHTLGRHQKQQQNVIPPPAQFMLTYQYLDPHCRYVLRPSSMAHGSEEYLLSIAGPPSRSKSDHQHFVSDVDGITSAESQTKVHSSGHHHHQQQQHLPPHPSHQFQSEKPPHSTDQIQNTTDRRTDKSNSTASNTSRQCHGHSCNPCLGQRKDKSNNGSGAGGDNVSLEAYDLASPCCNPHCVPTRRRTKHHKDHHHKHKHRDKDQKEQRPQRPRSQSHADSPAMHSIANHHHPTQQSQHNEKQAHRPRFYDISTGLASHCSLHSCTSSEFGATESGAGHHCGAGGESSVASYSTSLSTDTLYWDPETSCQNSRQQSTKSRQSAGPTTYQNQHHPQHTPSHATHPTHPPQQPHQSYGVHPQQHLQQRYHIHAAQVQPTSYDYHTQQQQPAYVQKKPKSWDNLALKGMGGYGFGYGYLDTVGQMAKVKMTNVAGISTATMPNTSTTNKHPQLPSTATLLLAQQQQRHSMPRKNPYGRYSTFSDVENYAPPPSQFVQTITTTTITKSTENLLGTALNHSNTSLHSCEGCNEPLTGNPYVTQLHSVPNQKYHDCRGYYSHLPRVRTVVGHVPQMSQGGDDAASVSNGGAQGGVSGNVMGRQGVATVSEITRL